MKKFLLLLLALLPVVTMLAQVDSSAHDAFQGNVDDADFAPGLFVMAVVFLLGMLIAFIFCLAAAAVLAFFSFLLITAGIVSVAVFMAWYQRSIYTGVKWLVCLSFCMAGMVGTSFVCLLLDGFDKTNYSLKTMLSWGIPAGLVGGLLSSWVLLSAFRWLYRYLLAKKELLSGHEQ